MSRRSVVISCVLVLVLFQSATVVSAVQQKEKKGRWLKREFKHFRVYPRMDRGYKLYNSGQFDEAATLFAQVLEIDEHHTDARKMIMEICLKKKDMSCIKEQADSLVTSDPLSPYGHYYLAKASALKGDSERVVTEGHKSLEKPGLSREQSREVMNLMIVHSRKAGMDSRLRALLNETCGGNSGPDRQKVCLKQKIDYYLLKGKKNKALSTYNTYKNQYGKADNSDYVYWANMLDQRGDTKNAWRVASRLPKKAPYLEFQVNLLEKLGEYHTAARYLETNASDAEKGTAEYWATLATLYYKSGNIDAEFKALSTGIGAAKNNDILYVMLSDRLIAMKQHKEAIEVLETHLKKTGSNATRKKLATLYTTEKEYQKAIGMTEALIKTSKEGEEKQYLNRLILLLEKEGEWERLAEVYRSEIRMGTPYEELALPAGLTGKSHADKKIAILRRGYPYKGAPRKYRVELMIALATLYHKTENGDKALTVLKKLSTEPDLIMDERERVAILAHTLGDCTTALAMSGKILQEDETSVDAALVAGYCMQRKGKPGLAAFYLEMAYANIPGKESQIRYHVQKSLGYFYSEMEEPDTALRFWAPCLRQSGDSLLSLHAAEVSLRNNDTVGAQHLIARVDTNDLSPQEKSNYLVVKATLSEKDGDDSKAGDYYRDAIELNESVELWRRYSANQYARGNDENAVRAMQQAVNLDPENPDLIAELGYLNYKTGRYHQAILVFNDALELRPDDCRYMEAIGHAELAGGNKKKSLETFEKALECRRAHPESFDETEGEKIYALKRSIDILEKKWAFSFTESFRLNEGENGPKGEHLVNNSSYSGFGSLDVSYLPEKFSFGRGNYVQVFGRLLWDNKDVGVWPVAGSLQGGLGLRYKPLADYTAFLALERLVKLGGKSRNDWMLRASASDSVGLDWESSLEEWMYRNIYLDSAWLTKNGNSYLTANGEFGKGFRITGLPVDAAVIPYAIAGARYNNDNPDKSSVTLADIGAGVALVTKHADVRYIPYDIRNRMTLEGRFKIGGNSDDKNSLALKVEVAF